MKKNIKNERQAAQVFHPGVILLDELNERQLTQAEFSEIIGRPARTVNEIIKGKRGITPETAGVIAAGLGTSPDMWLSMQGEYDLFTLNKKSKDKPQEIQERSELYSLFPIADLVRRDYIKRKVNVNDLEKDVLSALGLSSVNEFRTFVGAQFRASEGDIVHNYLKAWVVLAKKIASSKSVGTYNQEKLTEFAKTIKGFSSDVNGIKKVIQQLNKLGVRVVFLPHFSKTRVDGAACWLDKKKPLIVMSLRYQRVDNFYFTLLHEIGHIILHSSSDDHEACFIDDIHSPSKDEKEKDANKFAVRNLGLEGVASGFKFQEITPKILNKKSEELGIHASILIGHLQYASILNYSAYQRFLNKYKVEDMISTGSIEK